MRDTGVITGRENNKWRMQFDKDGAEHLFERRALWKEGEEPRQDQEVAAGRRRSQPVEAASSDDEACPAIIGGEGAAEVDSSDEEEGNAPVGQEDHDSSRPKAPNDVAALDEWVRDDEYGVDERAKHGFTDASGPRLSGLTDWESASLFSLAMHFLPTDYMEAMAHEMQEKGKQKHAEQGSARYVNWKVSRDDIIQWIE